MLLLLLCTTAGIRFCFNEVTSNEVLLISDPGIPIEDFAGNAWCQRCLAQTQRPGARGSILRVETCP